MKAFLWKQATAEKTVSSSEGGVIIGQAVSSDSGCGKPE